MAGQERRAAKAAAAAVSGGLALSRQYWDQCGLPGLQEAFAPLLPRVAAGLLGEGSECLGYDDALSRDHDWGPGFCLWLSEEDLAQSGAALAQWYANLPQSFAGVPVKTTAQRVGVFAREAFIGHFIGALPTSNVDWLRIPESWLAVCTAGEIFYDPQGEMTNLVQRLRACPEQVRRKKLAARCAAMGQAGQYNFPRCESRSEVLAAQLALREFAMAAASAAFLLNGRWMPFYKWMPRALRDLPHLSELEPLLTQLLQPSLLSSSEESVARICAAVAQEMRRQGLTALGGAEMQQLGQDVQNGLTDEALRALPLLAG